MKFNTELFNDKGEFMMVIKDMYSMKSIGSQWISIIDDMILKLSYKPSWVDMDVYLIVYLHNESTKTLWRKILPIRKKPQPNKTLTQWGHSIHYKKPKKDHGSCGRYRNWYIYVNTHEDLPMQKYYVELNHPYIWPPLQFDNRTYLEFSNKKIKQKHSKSIEMRLYWLQDHIEQGQLLIHCSPGNGNLGD